MRNDNKNMSSGHMEAKPIRFKAKKVFFFEVIDNLLDDDSLKRSVDDIGGLMGRYCDEDERSLHSCKLDIQQAPFIDLGNISP